MEVLYLLCSIFCTTVTSIILSTVLIFRRFLSPRTAIDVGDHVTLYQGMVWHERRRPVNHSFQYSVRYAFIDLDNAPNPPQGHLSPIEARRISNTNGPVFLLTIPPSVGYEQNPLSLYYCYDIEGPSQNLRNCIAENQLIRNSAVSVRWEVIQKVKNNKTNVYEFFKFIETIYPTDGRAMGRALSLGVDAALEPMAFCFFSLMRFLAVLALCFNVEGILCPKSLQVTNTPWGERVLFLFDPNSDIVAKPLHVSPFMDMLGNWSIKASVPGANLSVVISIQHPELGHYFTASVTAKRVPSQIAGDQASFFWLMPHKVALWIYWHALKLWWKNVPFIQHPRYHSPAYRDEALLRQRKLQCSQLSEPNKGSHGQDNGIGTHESELDVNNRCFTWRGAKWPWC